VASEYEVPSRRARRTGFVGVDERWGLWVEHNCCGPVAWDSCRPSDGGADLPSRACRASVSAEARIGDRSSLAIRSRHSVDAH
jgi:hypothetical protein